MAVAHKIERFLERSGIDYDVAHHAREVVASRIAQRSHVPGEAFAKGVLVKADDGYVLAVVPASHNVDLSRLSLQLGERLGLANEAEIDRLFDDCDIGAVPACGTPYGLRVVVDESLDSLDDVYFEAGDHENLIHLHKDAWAQMTEEARHLAISRHI